MNRIFNNWWKDLKLIAYCVGVLMAFRLAMMVYFYGERTTEGFGVIITALQRAMLFDLRIACFVALPTVILGMVFGGGYLDRLRVWIGGLFGAVTVILGIVNFGFFWEYHDQFNHWVYGMFYDDTWAIMETIWESNPVFIISVGTSALVLLSVWVVNKVFRRNREIRLSIPLLPQLIVVVLLLGLFVIGLRGSIESRPLQRDDIGVTPDMFLNRLVSNAYFALYYTRSEHKHLNQAEGLTKFLADGDLRKALEFVNPEKVVNGSLSDWMKREVSTSSPESKPQHIFIVVLESQDSWTMLDEYEDLGLSPNLKRMSKDGVYVKNFVSAGTNTRATLNSIISGLPDAGVYTNYQPRSKEEVYDTAFARAFQGMGYEVNLFYGGYLSWQRLGEFAKEQGFDNVYGREHMGSLAAGSWGVYDEGLFGYIVETLKGRGPTVNLIMTTTNHSPYPVDVDALGFDKKIEGSATERKILGHQWYNDYCINKFVGNAQTNLDSPLFVVTGDHTSRRFYKSQPSLYELKSVPLIIYGAGAEALQGASESVGSHIDIVPTLVEWLAEPGYEYYSIGQNLTESGAFGIGADIVMTKDKIWWVGQGGLEKMPAGQEAEVDIVRGEKLYNSLHGIAWWRIMKGDSLN